jgi:transmembrane protein 177
LNRNGKEVELDSNLQALKDSVMSDIHLGPKRKTLCTFFHSNEVNVVSYGSLLTIWGALISLPYYFSYSKPTDVNINHIKIRSKYDIDWNSKSGKKLLNSFILSDAAKKFAIAREVHFADSIRLYSQTFFIYVAGFSGYYSANYLTKKNGITNKPFLTLLPIYMIAFFTSYIFYLIIQGIADDYIDHEVDLRTVKNYQKDYINGGLEYYQKLLERNKALRDLLGEAGLQMFNPEGDEIMTLFNLTRSLVKKVNYLQQFKNENESKFVQTTSKEAFI